MWFQEPPRRTNWRAARAHLSRVDPVMKRIIRRVGSCTLARRRDYFVVLCKSIFTQQISTRIATILYGRFSTLFPRKRPTPRLVLRALEQPLEQLKWCGLSRQKRAYIRDLAAHFADGRIPTRRFNAMHDEAIIESLARVKGIGRWTAEMFLIFVLNRPDVLPVDDLGLREAVKRAYNLAERPAAKQLREIGERWRPYRTIATWYLWRSLG